MGELCTREETYVETGLAAPAFELAALRAVCHSKGPKGLGSA
jgi:hypothetical protein